MGQRAVFVGNRRFVLEELLSSHLDVVSVMVIEGSHLHKDLENGFFSESCLFNIVRNKKNVLEQLQQIEFDLLVSNGCPFILPISDLPTAAYVNVHPSCLPDLRGIDPVIGSVLFAKDSGATCHIMDDGVDTGPIISQVRIPYSDDLDVTTVYQLSFLAEARVFNEALQRNFAPEREQESGDDDVHYNRRSEDMTISFFETNDMIIRKVRAFNNMSIGCSFKVNENSFKVYNVCRATNSFLIKIVNEFPAGEIAMSFENSIIFHKDGEILRFTQLVNKDGITLKVGDRLF